MDTSASLNIFKAYSKITPGGVQSNFRFEEPYPLYFKRAKGSRMWDVDGNEYTDFIVGYGSIILGHNDPTVSESVIASLESGLTSGVETEESYKLSQTLCDMIPSGEAARVSTSGTEAVMHALMLARTFTKKNRVVKIEGAYHGWYDPIAVSHYPPLDRAGSSTNPTPVPNTLGLDQSSVASTLVVPFNDSSVLSNTIKQHKNEIAAVIIEPVCFNIGAVLPKRGYLEQVREITSSNDILLIFDEVITGFRLAPGGAQEYYHVDPDLSIFGKALGNGYPISALVGRSDIIELSKPHGSVAYSGTYNGNQLSLAAAEATLSVLKTGEVQDRLQKQTLSLQSSVEQLSQDNRVGVRVQGIGGQFQIYFADHEITDYRGAAQVNRSMYSEIRKIMKENGLLFHPHPLFHHGVTNAHRSDDFTNLINQIESFVRKQARIPMTNIA